MGGPQDTIIKSATGCFNPNFTFPSITAPGLPKFMVGIFLTCMGGINLVLDFLPIPDPTKIGNLKIPSLDFFMQICLKAVGLPDIPGWSPLGGLNLIFTCVNMILGLFTKLILGIFELSPSLPTIDLAISLFLKFGAKFGLPASLKFQCIPLAVIGLLKSLLPL